MMHPAEIRAKAIELARADAAQENEAMMFEDIMARAASYEEFLRGSSYPAFAYPEDPDVPRMPVCSICFYGRACSGSGLSLVVTRDFSDTQYEDEPSPFIYCLMTEIGEREHTYIGALKFRFTSFVKEDLGPGKDKQRPAYRLCGLIPPDKPVPHDGMRASFRGATRTGFWPSLVKFRTEPAKRPEND